MNKIELLKSIRLGNSVAEQEADSLQDYFFETDQWNKILSGDVDIVYGQKGAGKSALFSLLSSKEYEFISRSVLIVSASNMRGESVFSSLQYDPPPTEVSFVYLWKIYILALLATKMKEYEFYNNGGEKLILSLEESGLLPRSMTIESMFFAALKWIKDKVNRNSESVEHSITFDENGMPIFSRKVSFEKGQGQTQTNFGIPINDLLKIANSALKANNFSAWILFDRLDVAFNETVELEKNALRALFKVYLDMFAHTNIKMKIFVRDDIWKRITADGFREASHIVNKTTIIWDRDGLLNLIMRRILNNNSILKQLSINKSDVVADIKKQTEIFYRLVPEKVDTGKNPQTFDWIVTRISDGQKISTPRDMIGFFQELITAQIKRIEQGIEAPEGERLFDRAIFKQALAVVSNTKYLQTLSAEYPEYKAYFEALRGKKAEHNIETLSVAWKDVAQDIDVRSIADRLVDIGFFERRKERDNTSYWTPFLYRDALSMVQGKAFSSEYVEEE